MRSIPSTLKAKIEAALQIIYADNDPRLDIIVAQTQKYLTPGLLLTPYTVRVGAVLGPLDIAVRREDANEIPQGLSMVYIENGTAKIAWLDIHDHVGRGWQWQYDIGPAVDCAIDYDGRWERITSFNDLYFHTTSRWALVTFGLPYIALVKPDGSLTVQVGQGAPLTLAADNVTKISLMRSWKNVLLWNHDHGIIAGYIRSGEVRYRSYAQQADGVTTLWENERTLTEFDTSVNPAVNLALFRTNDYRTGILVEIDGEIHMATSTRNWAGMAIQDHTISVTGTEVLVDLIPVTFENFNHNHTIAVEGTEVSVTMLYGVSPLPVAIENPDAFTIVITFDHDIYNASGQQAAFTVTDENTIDWSVTGTAAGATTREIILVVENFNNAAGELAVEYDGTGTIVGEAGQPLESFSLVFTPADLEPTGDDPPEVEEIYND